MLPFPCSPPPHELSPRTIAKIMKRAHQSRGIRLGCRFQPHNNAAMGNDNQSEELARAAGVGAVVTAVTVTTESPRPELVCGGLKLHVVSAGAPAQVKVTLPGKVPVVGETSSE